jgi:hypothetical protein
MASAITITGDAAAQRKLRAIGDRARHQRSTFERQARNAQRRITGVPVDSGRLRQGITGAESTRVVTDYGYRIGTDVPYARFVFRGTKYMAARPPTVPRDLGADAARAIAGDLRRV